MRQRCNWFDTIRSGFVNRYIPNGSMDLNFVTCYHNKPSKVQNNDIVLGVYCRLLLQPSASMTLFNTTRYQMQLCNDLTHFTSQRLPFPIDAILTVSKQKIEHTLNSLETAHTSPSRASHEVSPVSTLEKICSIITALWTLHKCITPTETCDR